MKPLLPDDEAARLEALRQYRILDTPPEAAFDDITRLARQLCQTPIALVSLVDADRQWFKSRLGLEAPETCRDAAFCAHAILQSETLIIPDALADDRFATNSLVTGAPHIRFYMGTPLVSSTGQAVGTLCVIDYQPRTPLPGQVEALQSLSRQVVKELERRRDAIAQERHRFERQQKRRPGFFKTIVGGFGLSSALLIGLGALFFDTLAQGWQTTARVNHTYEVLTAIATLGSQVKDARIGERSYVITGQTPDLAAYQAALAALPQQQQYLRRLTADNPRQQQRLDGLDISIQQLLAMLKQGVALYDTNAATVAARLSLTEQEDQWLANTSQILQAMTAEENTLLQERAQKAEAITHTTVLILVGSIGINLSILWSVYYLINREIKVRKQTEATLEQERDFSGAVLNIADALVLVVEAQGQVLRFNSACEDLTGYSFMAVRGQTIWELNRKLLPLEAQASDPLSRVMEHLVPTAFPQQYESHWLAQDGTQRLIAWSNTALLNQEGIVEYIICTGIDMTEQQQAEASLQQQREWLSVTLSSIGDAVIATDTTAKITFMNPVAEALTGWSATTAQGQDIRTVFRIIDEKTRQAAKNPVEAVLQNGLTAELANGTLLLTADHKEIPIADSCAPICNPSNELYGAVLVFRDVSKSQADQAQLRLLESVVVHANEAILITEGEPIDAVGPRIVYVNDAFTQMTGYTPDEVQGKTPRLLQGAKSDRATLDTIRAALTAWQPVKVELINYHKNGTEAWVELNIVPVTDERGWCHYWVSFQRDITERKKIEAETLKALAKEKELNELKSRFVSMVSHEFRTPLTTILSSTELLEASSYTGADDRQQRHYRQIKTAIQRMTVLLNGVLLLGRVEAGKLAFNPTPLNLLDFCHALVDEMQLTAGSKHTITLIDQGSCTAACLDVHLLQCILTNLLSNAVKYSPQGGTIQFTLACHNGDATFQICDEGIGIPAADRDHLFESFHRGANVGNIEGTGLGLAIVKHAVDLHGGTIDVANDTDRGTTFTVTLPLVSSDKERFLSSFGDLGATTS